MNELITIGFNGLVEAKVLRPQKEGDLIGNWLVVVDGNGNSRKARTQNMVGFFNLGEI